MFNRNPGPDFRDQGFFIEKLAYLTHMLLTSTDSKIYVYRFEIFFVSLLVLLFGSVFFPFGIYDKFAEPIFYILNLLSGIQLSRNHKLLYRLGFLLILMGVVTTILEMFLGGSTFKSIIVTWRFFIYFFFYLLVTYEIITQVWSAKEVTNNVMVGLMSGYICLGLVGLFAFLAIDLFVPGSFVGLDPSIPRGDQLLYLSFITLLTVGYGDMLPATDIAHRASILIGLVGQFYLVIIMAVVLEKFIRHRNKKVETDL